MKFDSKNMLICSKKVISSVVTLISFENKMQSRTQFCIFSLFFFRLRFYEIDYNRDSEL